MSDLVNDTARKQLSKKNSEPTNLKGGSYEEIGGPKPGGEDGADAYKIDAERGVTQDTSIPKSVGAEKSHLTTEDDDELDVKFDDEDDMSDTDDLDDDLDQFESLEDLDVKVGDDDLDEEDESDEKDLDEEDEDDDAPKKALKEASDDEDKDLDEDENPFAKKDDEDKDVVKEEDEDDEKKIDEEDESDEKDLDEDENPFAKKDDEDKDLDEEDDSDEEKDVVKEEDEDDDVAVKKVAESVRVRIKMPNVKLFESLKLAPKNQKKIAVVFESAIRKNTKQIAKQLHEHFKAKYTRTIAKRDQLMQKNVDSYMNYVTEEWMKQNKVAVRTSLRSQLAEEFLNGLKTLFTEHYIDVPESKVDVVKTLSARVDSLKSKLNEQVKKTMKLRSLAEQANRLRIISDFARKSQLTESEASRMTSLAENVQYTNAKEFRSKLAMLKESYFGAAGSKKSLKHLPEETLQEEVTKKSQTQDPNIDPEVAAVMEALERSGRKW